MVKNKQQRTIDLIILIALIVLIYYLRIKAGDTVFNPAQGAMSLLGIGG